MAEVDMPWVIMRLKHSLQALAMPADVQIALFPEFAQKADELALDFDNFRQAVVTNMESSLSDEQRDLLATIDVQLDMMSRAQDANLWTEDALVRRPEWQSVRELASAALEAFDWPVVRPPSYAHEFVQLARSTKDDADTVGS
jgi:hypothetical protein